MDAQTKELVRRITNLEKMKSSTASRSRIEDQHYAQALSATLGLPGLRACYTSCIDSGNRLMDMGPNGLHLTRNSGPVALRGTTQLSQYTRYYGSSDYFYHADDGDFDILGTETGIHGQSNGLTLLAWVYCDTAAGVADEYLISKWEPGTVANDSYRLIRRDDGDLLFSVYNAGIVNVTSDQQVETDNWVHCAGTFDPSATMSTWVNGVETQLAAGVPASVQNGGASFMLGADSLGNNEFSGNLAYVAVCAMVLPEIFIQAHYELTRSCFGRF